MFHRFEQLADPFEPDDAATPTAGVWAFIRHQIRPLRGIIATSLAFGVVGAAIEVWLIFYAGHLVDLLAATSPADLWTQHGLELFAVALLVLIARPLTGFIREALNDIAFRPNAETMIRWRSHRQVLGQSVGWFRNQQAGRIVTQVQSAGTSATGAAYQVLNTLSFVTIYMLGTLLVLGSVDVRLAIPLVIWIALYIGLGAYTIPRYRRASEAYQEANSDLTGLLVDSYANIDTLKLFGNPHADDRESRDLFDSARRAFFGIQRMEVTFNAGMLTLGSLLMVGLVGYALILWQGGGAPIGLVAAAVALSFRITGMAEWMLDAVSNLFGHLGTLREALKTVAEPLTLVDAPGAVALKVTGGAIQFVDVSHSYGGNDGGLDRLTLSIAAGEKVGLVGRSGAGKSTLVNLLLRFFELESGRIEVDGQDISAVMQESLRLKIAMVAQDAALLHRSVRDNIAYGRAGVTDADIEMAARKAAADGFIHKLRDQSGRTGFDAHVGERGVRLSGGQRQRIAIARAILKDAPILVLDEATSALDSEVEAAIRETLDEVMANKTVIAIAHRLSTIARMDRIVVLDAGRIVEDGTHDQLIDAGGIYASLWSRQSGGFIA